MIIQRRKITSIISRSESTTVSRADIDIESSSVSEVNVRLRRLRIEIDWNAFAGADFTFEIPEYEIKDNVCFQSSFNGISIDDSIRKAKHKNKTVVSVVGTK